MSIRVSLDRYLRTQGVSAYRLAQETAGRVARGSVFALARGEKVKRVDLETLGEVMSALERITGHPVTPNDLIEVIEEPVPPLRSLKPGEIGDTKLHSESPSGTGKPRGLGANRIVPKGGRLVSTAVREARDERERKL